MYQQMHERRRKGGVEEEEGSRRVGGRDAGQKAIKPVCGGGEPEGRSFRAIIPAAEHRVQVLGGGKIYGSAVFSLTLPPPLTSRYRSCNGAGLQMVLIVL